MRTLPGVRQCGQTICARAEAAPPIRGYFLKIVTDWDNDVSNLPVEADFLCPLFAANQILIGIHSSPEILVCVNTEYPTPRLAHVLSGV